MLWKQTSLCTTVGCYSETDVVIYTTVHCYSETDIVVYYCWLLQWNRRRYALCWLLQSKQTSLCAMLIATVTRFVLFLPVDINIVRCPYSTQLFRISGYFVLPELNTVTEYCSESGQTLQLNTAVNHFALSRHHSWILQWIKSYCPNTPDEYYSESIRAVQTLQMNATVNQFVLSKRYRWILQWINSCCPNATDEYYSESIRAVQTLQMNTTVNHFVLSKHYSWRLQ